MMKIKLKNVLRLIQYWPPYLGAGIKVASFSKNINEIVVEMKLRFWNRNYFHTHFGGSLYTMTDPFFTFILLHHLGKEYIVWDKAATINFVSPGRSIVRAKFIVTSEQLKEIREQADTKGKTEPHFKVQVLDKDNNLVAEVEKVLYVKRKKNRNVNKP